MSGDMFLSRVTDILNGIFTQVLKDALLQRSFPEEVFLFTLFFLLAFNHVRRLVDFALEHAAPGYRCHNWRRVVREVMQALCRTLVFLMFGLFWDIVSQWLERDDQPAEVELLVYGSLFLVITAAFVVWRDREASHARFLQAAESYVAAAEKAQAQARTQEPSADGAGRGSSTGVSAHLTTASRRLPAAALNSSGGYLPLSQAAELVQSAAVFPEAAV